MEYGREWRARPGKEDWKHRTTVKRDTLTDRETLALANAFLLGAEAMNTHALWWIVDRLIVVRYVAHRQCRELWSKLLRAPIFHILATAPHWQSLTTLNLSDFTTRQVRRAFLGTVSYLYRSVS